MKEELLGRGGLVTLVFVVAIGLSMGTVAASDGQTLTVNCESPGYDNIQDAVNASSPGDRIEVCGDGGYDEAVVVENNESGYQLDGLEIVVQDGEQVVLDGGALDEGSNGFTVKANDVTIESFVVKNFDGDSTGGEGFAFSVAGVDGFSLSDTLIENSSGGIDVFASGGDEINGVTIERVAVRDTGFPLRVEAEGKDTLITDITVQEVALEKNQNRAFLKARDNAQIDSVTIERTGVKESGETGLAFGAEDGGVMSDVTVRESVFNNNSADGLALRSGGEANLKGVSISRISSQENEQYGVNLDLRADFKNVRITDSLIRDNELKGVFSRADGDISEDELDLSYNAITGNGMYGIFQEGDAALDARLNYWGASDGPSTHADAEDSPVLDPVYGHIADGGGDAVSEDPDEPGVSNVNFAPAIGAKSVCDTDQMVDVVPDGDFKFTVEEERASVEVAGERFDIEVDAFTVEGPRTDFVGICAWNRGLLPLRATSDNAGTSVDMRDPIARVPGEGDVRLNRESLNVHQIGEKVELEFGTASLADTSRFADESGQVLVARIDQEKLAEREDEGEDVDVEDLFEAEADELRGDISLETDLVDWVVVKDVDLNDDGELEENAEFTPNDDGIHIAILTVQRTGDGFSKTNENGQTISANIHEDDFTIAGVETIAVQATESSAEPDKDTVEAGDEVDFTLNATFEPEGDVGHAIVLFHDEQFQDTQLTAISDGEIDLYDLVLQDGELEILLERNDLEDEIVVTADGPFDTLTTDVTLPSEITVVNVTAAEFEGGEQEEIVTLTVGEDFEPGEYRYVHVAIDEEVGTFSTTTDTLEVVPPEADIQITDPELSETSIETGEAVDVTATLDNVGGADGELTVHLVVDGQTQRSETFTVGPTETKDIEFTTDVFEDEGEYDVFLNEVEVGTVTVEDEEVTQPPVDPPPTDPPPSPPPADPPVQPVPSPIVEKAPPDRIDVEVPGAISKSFGFDLPRTDAMNESAIRVGRVDATSTVDDGIDITLDTSRGPPEGVPAVDANPRVGHLYLDVGYSVDPDAWNSSTIEWEASTAHFADQDPDNFQLFRYNGTAEEWESIDTEFLGEDGDVYEFRSEADGFSVYAFATTEADFEVTEASLSDERITEGESIDVTATVENHGGGSGTFTAELRVDGDVVQTEDVTVGAGESEQVTFTETFEAAGTYDVDVSGTFAGTLEVTEEPVETPTTTPTPTPDPDPDPPIGIVGILILIGVLLGLVGAGVYYYTRTHHQGNPRLR